MNLPQRRSIRLKDYDYTGVGLYFVTICSHEKRCILGKVHRGKVHLSKLGEVVLERWVRIPITSRG